MFPENDFAPYHTIWHRDPGGDWAIYAHSPRLDIACPRYHDSASERNPAIGPLRLPARPIFAVGRAYFEKKDPEAYGRTVAELRSSEARGR